MSDKTGIVLIKGRFGSVVVQTTDTFKVTPFVLNTAAFSTLTTAAAGFVWYKPKRIRARAIPLNVLQTGVACMAFNSNPNATTPTTTSDMLNLTHRVAGPSAHPLTLEFWLQLNVEWLSCRVSGSIDNLLESFGVIWVSTDSTTSTYNNTIPFIVEVELEVEFKEFTNSTVSPALLGLLTKADTLGAMQWLSKPENKALLTNVNSDEESLPVKSVSHKRIRAKKAKTKAVGKHPHKK